MELLTEIWKVISKIFNYLFVSACLFVSVLLTHGMLTRVELKDSWVMAGMIIWFYVLTIRGMIGLIVSAIKKDD